MSVSETVQAQSRSCSPGRENSTCVQAPWAFPLRRVGLPAGEAVHRTGFVFEHGLYPELWLVCDTSNSSLFTSARRHLYRTQMPPRRSPFSSDRERIHPARGGRGWEGEAAVRLPSVGWRREPAPWSRRGCKVSRRPWSSSELRDSGGHAATTWPPRSHHSSQQPSPTAPPSAHTCFSLPLRSLSVQTFRAR